MVEATHHILGSKGLYNQALGASNGIAQTIKKASAQVGVDFAYMLTKATQESGLNPNAKASTSSATGLYQFVDQTWLRTVKSYGGKYGLGEMADKITVGKDGVARVSDPEAKKAILAMRKDPMISTEMAAELTNENKASLEANVGGKVGATELYLAHFLGAGGAAQFLNTMKNDPGSKAAAILPDAAAANQSVFYDKSGAPKSVAQIYKQFAQKFEHAPVAPTMTDIASAETVKPMDEVAKAYSMTHVAAHDYASPSTMSSGGHAGVNDFKLDGNGSSTFATMVLAQMDMGSLSPTARYLKDEE